MRDASVCVAALFGQLEDTDVLGCFLPSPRAAVYPRTVTVFSSHFAALTITQTSRSRPFIS